ncbi:alpha/beta hydrolase domain-containing protein [Monoraphidium neglectum]|uniref:Alpha/beta hydrolase domain-containing protein n=1 Tax=Monoraphidium neglectum TaxID=145388 RepID=A0A0D2MIR3_9CHLO|nr:alpha/beta hydrolase domain-containing protein [Monoraphidium neglectum]KIZ00537.1 alpha/beta hydrolase domain-containing protein [Monoraphidium neglectum]|eukprot:XP_013899556.1 alpha/beta hydrolase domain-containing protein [Monoraphidium neglectum]
MPLATPAAAGRTAAAPRPMTECPAQLFLPAPATLSRGASAFLSGTRLPQPPSPATLSESADPTAQARRAAEARRDAERQRAKDAAAWKLPSERYRAVYVMRHEVTSLGGVQSVLAEPRPGLRADGRPAGGVGSPAADNSSALLFFHGGGYRLGDPRAMFFAFAPLAAAAALPAYAPAYRLAPEHPFPAALDDALAAYSALIRRVDPARVALAGDSAGGGLAAALLLRAAGEGLPLPGAAVLFSPWAVLKGGVTDTSVTLCCADPMLNPDALAAAGKLYAGNASADDPLLSPAFGDYGAARAKARGGRFPPVLITCGTREVLLSDAVLLRHRMRAGGVDASISPYEGMWHSFNSRGSPGALDLPEAAAVITEAAEFIRKHIPHRQGGVGGVGGAASGSDGTEGGGSSGTASGGGGGGGVEGSSRGGGNSSSGGLGAKAPGAR